MLNSPYNSSAMVSSALPTLLTTVSQAGVQPAGGGINQLAGLGGQQQFYPQQAYPQPVYQQPMMGVPGYGMPQPQYGQAGFGPARVFTSVTQTVEKTFIPFNQMPMPYQAMPPQMAFGSRWY